jgi:hypothetical protein
MRVELINDRYLLCGAIIPQNAVQVGQVWAAADGSNHSVLVEQVANDWVTYSWIEKGIKQEWEKTNCAFQSRYCLVIGIL